MILFYYSLQQVCFTACLIHIWVLQVLLIPEEIVAAQQRKKVVWFLTKEMIGC